ncbi:MAG: DNA phosphorothioation-associated protein 4 [Cyanobacteria bacterium]|uniref:DNA phosphorothioation-associated protein 4 n=1 Tax=Geminocystis sp. TaxID=2664100 RepID=UPI001D228E95|nr:DNA phosphorothioation-associated protein 4 [Cyanobacteria bacterium CG_2015-16_32_12]NCO78849.1 DNA phosphorothioation-associated protein 4 [Cyanobacteria bacterium CG_2015-22_32_23]NCQ42577.1 DNA phosphorothioation-associated protein 4 [Cyanobacteria bacterium CG_2015-04_32_10]NCS84714.1 DNA phosphorothioation-associated protein 4 [Cyanobacteria bacterium CG_2015-02_32_10]
MAIRIKIAQDKANLVQSLVLNNQNSQGVFATYADIMAFAAALGKNNKIRLPLNAIAKEPSPISLDVFSTRGYDFLFKLLAITETHNPDIISAYDMIAEEERVMIFEEYANGGLMKLQDQLKGAVDYSERILLILNQGKSQKSPTFSNFDLTKFL